MKYAKTKQKNAWRGIIVLYGPKNDESRKAPIPSILNRNFRVRGFADFLYATSKSATKKRTNILPIVIPGHFLIPPATQKNMAVKNAGM